MFGFDKVEVSEEDIECGGWDGGFDLLYLGETLFIAVSVQINVSNSKSGAVRL